MTNGSPTSELSNALYEFAKALNEIADSPPQIERLLVGQVDLDEVIEDTEPEDWTEQNLIFPVVDAVGLNRIRGRPSRSRRAGSRTQREAPDMMFLEDDETLEIIGENKPPNNIETAIDELLTDYLASKWWGEYGIATDGFQWKVYRVNRSGSRKYQLAREADLRPTIRAICIEEGYINGDVEQDVQEGLNDFSGIFAPQNLVPILRREAPREFRDTRERDVDNFYELYIELLFGESGNEEFDYDTHLLSEIVSPDGATEEDERLFAVTLVNRLLFIKFLEGESDKEESAVLPHGFLQKRVDDYGSEEDSPLPGTLYKAVVEPLFNDLMDTKKDERSEVHKGEWFDDVPYLNGGLFQPIVENEGKYDVQNWALRTVITDLVEAGALELSREEDTIDPAILGSVFERTINHLSSEGGRQEETGAFYTPDDVTSLISEEIVDPKIQETIASVFADAETENEYTREAVEAVLNDRPLSRILRDIEQRARLTVREEYVPPEAEIGDADLPTQVDFGDDDAIETALERVRAIRVVDAACGSGHFLTTVMEDIIQAQSALLIGKNDGRDPSYEELYREKKAVALNSIFGVDVDEIAVEIAKLRVWLKMVEDNGWKEQFGELPSIDLNIVAGNSLVGYPIMGSMQAQIGATDDRVRELRNLRQQYKAGDEDVTRAEVLSLEQEIKVDRDEKYIQTLTYSAETRFDTRDEFDKFLESVPEGDLQSTVQEVKVELESGEHFDDETKEQLEELGAQVHSKSANFKPPALISEGNGMVEQENDLISNLQGLLDEGFLATRVSRQPTTYDIDKVVGEPVHWDIEFPEVSLDDNGGTPRVGEFPGFDIVIGNPPYGEDVLDQYGELFVEPYRTGGLPDVAAPFVERQLALLHEAGRFGNIVKLGLFYDSGYEEFWDLLRDSLTSRVACYGDRPRQVFQNADVRVGIITGEPSNNGEILTSDLLAISQDNRQEQFEDIKYGRTDGLVLRDGIDQDGDSGPYLPKVGPEIKQRILEKLRDGYTERLVDRYERDVTNPDDKYPVWRREGARYWINPMLEELYSARENEPFYFDTEIEQQACFITLQSSLYYAYWATYGNQHHHNWTHIEGFPFPCQAMLEHYEDRISELSDRLWSGMSDLFSTDSIGRPDWTIRPLKPLVSEVDELVGEMYGLTDEEVEWLQNYLTDLGDGTGRKSAPDDQIRNY